MINAYIYAMNYFRVFNDIDVWVLVDTYPHSQSEWLIWRASVAGQIFLFFPPVSSPCLYLSFRPYPYL